MAGGKKPKQPPASARIPADLAEQVRRLAIKENRTFAGQVVYMLRVAVQEKAK